MGLLNIPILTLILVLAFVLYNYFIYPTFISPLAKIPAAHPTASFSPIWIHWIRFRAREPSTIYAAHERLGPVVRLGPNEISVNSVKGGLQTIYSGGFEKWEFYKNLFENYGEPNMFSTLASRPHSDRKRKISNIYSKSFLASSQSLSGVASSLIYKELLPFFASKTSATPQPFDIFKTFSAIFMDFVTGYQFGLAHCAKLMQRPTFTKHLLEDYDARRSMVFWNQEFATLTKWLKRLGIRLIPKWVDEANREIEEFTLEMCDAAAAYLSRLEEQGAEKACDVESDADYPAVFCQLIGAMIKDSNSTDSNGKAPQKISEFYAKNRYLIASEFLDQLSAGFDTSSITMTYVIHELSARPQLQAALRSELLTLDPPIKPSSAPRLPNPKHLDALPLLHQIIYETLRLHPAIPGPQPRITPHSGCLIGPPRSASSPTRLEKSEPQSYRLPAGVRISAEALCLHQNEDVFPDAKSWKPERWEGGGTAEMNRWFWAFGSGGRMCIGSNLAFFQMKHILAAIYTNYTTSIVDDEGIEQADLYTAPPRGNKLIVKFNPVLD
ncbi:cytochrome P450 monooxygenase-like protein [Patellaria atrata CBS 101060]|uniref:Cytochrome P450 monooxygenase-like protein n=1 Tax=Patellaria atrata CBS 101060 TaxID=1346257 RepID=A0A9P4SHT5_9PEZI|nr:cytochrome P450 monooxygenase-like protein [Patellaria atrata CBS 101060]